jgi:hypothetical protein
MMPNKLISGLLTITTSLSFSAMGLASTAFAAPITEAQTWLSDSRSATASQHTFFFKVPSTTSIGAIRFAYRIAPVITAAAPSGLTTTAASLVGGLITTGATLVNGTVTGGTQSTVWTSTVTTAALPYITKAAGTGALTANITVAAQLSNITNNNGTITGAGECDTVTSSDTCYVGVTTFNTTATTPQITDVTTTTPTNSIDFAWFTYTVLSAVTVTATVDPSLTFTLAGVASGAIGTNDTNASCSGTNVTTTASTVPFGNMTVGAGNAKCGQHDMRVATNAANGYITYMKFLGATAAANTMQGIVTTNNIDPWTGTWGTPTAFTPGFGTVSNVNSGFIGARVVVAAGQTPGVAGFASSNVYAGPEVNNTNTYTNAVMNSNSPDAGSAASFTTYKFMVSALQPADTYTGTVLYMVSPKY